MKGTLMSLFGEMTFEEAMSDCRWILFFIAGNFMIVGFINAIISLQYGMILLGIGMLFIIAGWLKNFWITLAVLIGFTALLWVDFVLRHNPFSIVYSSVGIYHLYILFKWRAPAAKVVAK
jgi:hypothetical protein